MVECLMINPSLKELKRNMRKYLYEWDEVKATITADGLLVWLDDVHHVDLMSRLNITTRERYDIVICLTEGKVEMTRSDRNFTILDMNKVKNNKDLQKIITDFEVILENPDDN